MDINSSAEDCIILEEDIDENYEPTNEGLLITLI